MRFSSGTSELGGSLRVPDRGKMSTVTLLLARGKAARQRRNADETEPLQVASPEGTKPLDPAAPEVSALDHHILLFFFFQTNSSLLGFCHLHPQES